MKACLFDHDGTLADSEVTFTRSMQAGFREVLNKELSAEEYTERCVGVSVEDWQGYLLESAEGDRDLRDALWQSIEKYCLLEFTNGVRLFPGTEPALKLLAERSVPAALVTNSSLGHLKSMHKDRPFLDHFASVVTPERVARPKPHPEMYQLGAREVGHDPVDCFAFEDSRPGAQAALDAGCKTVVVINGGNDKVVFPSACELLPIDQLPAFLAANLSGG